MRRLRHAAQCSIWTASLLLVVVISSDPAHASSMAAKQSPALARTHEDAPTSQPGNGTTHRINEPNHHYRHKPLFPMDTSDMVALSLTAVVAFVAAGAGIGGGGILLPIFVLICKFKVHQAVALSEWCSAACMHALLWVLGASFRDFSAKASSMLKQMTQVLPA